LTLLTLAVGEAGATTVEGFAEPFREVVVSSATEPERVTSLEVDEGTAVGEGQLLATLDTNVLRASLEIARKRATMQGRIVAADTEYKIRDRRLSKIRQLRPQGHATQAELDRAELDLATAKANVMMTREEQLLSELEVTRIQAEIDRRTIRSPINGVVSEVHREVGEVTQLSDPRLVTLVQLNPLKVKFSMTVAESTGLKVGDVLPVEVAEAGITTDAKIDAIAPVLDATSGTVKVTCVFDNADGEFRSGMRCRLDIEESSVPAHRPADLTFPVSGGTR
jgi:RND family efflux transporter MFP subunit